MLPGSHLSFWSLCLGSVIRDQGPLTVSTQSENVGLGLCVGLCVLGTGEAECFRLPAGWASPWDATAQSYRCVNLAQPQIAHQALSGICLPPDGPNPFHICQGEMGGARVALPHLSHPWDIPESDESGGDNRENNKS